MATPWFDDLTLQLDDDFDDEEQLSASTWKVDIQSEIPEKTGGLKCKLLIVALGDSPYLFTNKFLRAKCGNAETVGRLRLSKATDDIAHWENALIKRTESVLWRSGEVAVVECRHEVLSETANTWAEALLDFIKSEEVLVLSTFPAVRFQGADSIMDLVPMMRSLPMDLWMHKQPWPVLESPNMVLGSTAAVLTQGQLRGISSAVYTLVVGMADVDVDDLEQWLQALQSDVCQPHFSNLVSTPRADILAQLRRIVPPPSSSGSMFQ